MNPVTCVGALHLDAKARLAAPVVAGSSNPVAVMRTPGGVACNVARTLARLEIPVALVSVVGDDDAGRGLLRRLAAEGVDVSAVVVLAGAATAGYTAVLDPDGGLVVGLADMAIYDRLDGAVVASAPIGGGLVFADANVAASGLDALGRAGDRLLLDPVSVAKSTRLSPVLRGAVVFPDRAEAEALTGESDPVSAAGRLMALGVARAVVTCGPDGVIVADDEGVFARPAVGSGPVADVTGAGDALVAGYLAALATGAEDPVGWGLAAASLAIETLDTVPTDLDLGRLLARLPTG